MAACWRALSRRPGMDVHVLHPRQLWGIPNPFLAESRLLEGISNEIFDADAPGVDQWLLKTVAKRNPHIVVLCGWVYKAYLRLVHSGALDQARIVLGMDSPWRGTLPQRLAKFRLGRLVKRLNLVVTVSGRSWEYARRIGVPESRIRTGYYGFDYELFGEVARGRSMIAGEWPRQFLFVGRYVPQKNLPTLLKAYSAYRRCISEPWGLTCCGEGVDGGLLKGAVGVVDTGFTEPSNLPAVFSRHGALVLASQFEPWGVVIAEAAASGMPVVCSTACGAAESLVRPYYNGLVVGPRDVAGLARAMRWMHEHVGELAVMGRRGQTLAESYSAEVWAARWHNYFLDAVETPARNGV